jgi:predicted MFS family arabinose efflux permease
MQFEMSMFAMVALGIGEIFGGIMMGFIVDKIGAKRSCLINVVLVLL